jgi:hypothetical protein
MAGENTEFRFDDFTVAAPTAPAGGATATASFAPASRLVTASYGATVQQIDATGVSIPENALSTDTVVKVAREETTSEAQSRKRLEEQLQPASDEIEFAPFDARFKTPVSVVLGYDPARLAAAKIKEKDLKVYLWDGLLGELIVLPSTIDKDAHTVSAQTEHFSLYQLMAPDGRVLAADAAFGWKAHYVFPNPVRDSRTATFRIQPGVVDGLELRVYDAAARRVYSSSDFRNLGAFDDGNGLGPQFTYENVWDVSGIGSGVYTYIVIAKKGGRGEIRESGKVGVVK